VKCIQIQTSTNNSIFAGCQICRNCSAACSTILLSQKERQPEWREKDSRSVEKETDGDGLKEMTAMNAISPGTSEHNLHCIPTWVCSWGCLLWFVLARFVLVWIFSLSAFLPCFFLWRTENSTCHNLRNFASERLSSSCAKAETLVSFNLYMSGLLSWPRSGLLAYWLHHNYPTASVHPDFSP